MKNRSLEELDGVWAEPDVQTGLILRCHAARKKPISNLTDLELATLLNQGIGVVHILPEAKNRITSAQPDDTEMFDGQLAEAIKQKE
jgi:hypothetical protein